MNEILNQCLTGSNLIASILLIVVAAYWLFVVLGFVGVDAFDLDFDADIDAGDFSLDGHPEGYLNLPDLLNFFHLGQVPVMIFGSFFALFFWGATVATNHYFNPAQSGWTMLWLAGPCVLVALLAAKFCVMPMVPMFEDGDKQDEKRRNLIGQTATVSSLVLNSKRGQISIELPGSPPLVLNARTAQPPDNHETDTTEQELAKGDLVRVDQYDQHRDICIVSPTT